MALYELLVLGSPTRAQLDALNASAREVANDFSLVIPDDFVLRTGPTVPARDPKASSVALYFGGDPSIDAAIVDDLEAAKVPIIPVVPPALRLPPRSQEKSKQTMRTSYRTKIMIWQFSLPRRSNVSAY
jgi:hypothetical protein